VALQIEVSKVSVKDGGEKFAGKLLNVTMRLKCWSEGADKETESPIIDQNFSEKYKEIPELTSAQQITITATAIKIKMQEAIDEYKREQILLAHPSLDAAVIGIQNALEG